MTVFLGLTGSIGMGKSTTAQMFRELGVPVLDADAVVHALYSGEAAPLVEAAFPGTVVDGTVDRRILSTHVVGNETAMKKLESLIHPLVQRETQAFCARVEQDDVPLAVLDNPLLFEMGDEDSVDGIIVVTAPADTQRERVLARPGMTDEKFQAILQKQMPDSEKRKRADFIIDTAEGMERAKSNVAEIVEQITSGKWSKRRHTEKSENA